MRASYLVPMLLHFVQGTAVRVPISALVVNDSKEQHKCRIQAAIILVLHW